MSNPFEKKKRIEDYYREEHQYLIEAGREFSRVHPGTAGFLNIDQIDDRDPYVERLFEGFSFLIGRIRQRLDNELPELTQSLLGFLWPHLLSPIPSLSILEFSAIPGRIQEPYIIKRGTEVVEVGVIEVNPVDTTGAGDSYAAGFLYGLINNLSLKRCGEIGALVSGKCIEAVGSKMTKETWKEIDCKVKEICR